MCPGQTDRLVDLPHFISFTKKLEKKQNKTVNFSQTSTVSAQR